MSVDSDSDSTISVTSTVGSDQAEQYDVEGILAERKERGEVKFLAKWDGYDLFRCTWEVEENFHPETIAEWHKKKQRFQAGEEDSFDVNEFYDAVEKEREETARRKARRNAKRRRLRHEMLAGKAKKKRSKLWEEESDSDGDNQSITIRSGRSDASSRSSSRQPKQDDDRPARKRLKSSAASAPKPSEQPQARRISSSTLHLQPKPTPQPKKNSAPDQASPQKRQSLTNGSQSKRQAPASSEPDHCKNRVVILKVKEAPQPPQTSAHAGQAISPKSKPGRLGAKGAGPKKAFHIETRGPSRLAKERVEGAAVFGNWTRELKARKRVTGGDIDVTQPIDPNAKQFENHHKRNRYEKYGRIERAPDINALAFVDQKTGTAIATPTNVLPPRQYKSGKEVTTKSPFELAQEARAQKESAQPLDIDDQIKQQEHQNSPINDSWDPLFVEQAIESPVATEFQMPEMDQAGQEQQRRSSTSLLPDQVPEKHGRAATIDNNEVDRDDAKPSVPMKKRRMSLPLKAPDSLVQAVYAERGRESDVQAKPEWTIIQHQKPSPQSPLESQSPKNIPGTQQNGDPRIRMRPKQLANEHSLLTIIHPSAEQNSILTGRMDSTIVLTHSAPKSRDSGYERDLYLQRGCDPEGAPRSQAPHAPLEELKKAPPEQSHQFPDATSNRFDDSAPMNSVNARPIHFNKMYGDLGEGRRSIVYGSIALGPRDEATVTDTQLFGLLQHNKYLFLTIRERASRDVTVWLDTLCSATEYMAHYHEDGKGYYGAGHVAPFNDKVRQIEDIARTLRDTQKGGLFFAKEFLMLVFPAGTPDWDFIDRRYDEMPNVDLRFVIRTQKRRVTPAIALQKQTSNSTTKPKSESASKTSLAYKNDTSQLPILTSPIDQNRGNLQPERRQAPSSTKDTSAEAYNNFATQPTIPSNTSHPPIIYTARPPSPQNNMSLSQLHSMTPQAAGAAWEFIFKSKPESLFKLANGDEIQGSPVRIYLHYPPEMRDEKALLAVWLQKIEGLRAKVYDDLGEWNMFISNDFRSGIVISHASMPLNELPRLRKLLKESFNLFKISIPDDGNLFLKTLFPSGGAFLLLDSLVLDRPGSVLKYLTWFRRFTQPGSWTFVVRPKFRKFLGDIYKDKEQQKPGSGKQWKEIHETLVYMAPESVMDPDLDYDTPLDTACYASPYEIPNYDEEVGFGPKRDNKALIAANDDLFATGFGQWSLTKAETYRRFYIITEREEQVDVKNSKGATCKPFDLWQEKWQHLKVTNCQEFEGLNDINRQVDKLRKKSKDAKTAPLAKESKEDKDTKDTHGVNTPRSA